MKKAHVVWFVVITLAIVVGGWVLYSLIETSKRVAAEETSNQNALAFENRQRIGFNTESDLPAKVPPKDEV